MPERENRTLLFVFADRRNHYRQRLSIGVDRGEQRGMAKHAPHRNRLRLMT